MKLSILIGSSQALARLSKEKTRAAAAAKLVELYQQVETAFKGYEEARIGLCEMFGEKVEGNPNYQIKPESSEEFSAKIKELLDTDVTIEFKPLPVFSLGDPNISVEDLLVLDWVIDSKTE